MSDEKRRTIDRIEIRCERCGRWFRSGIHLGDDQTFDTSTLVGNRQRCPHCRELTGCNKDNMRWVSADGETGFLGNKAMP